MADNKTIDKTSDKTNGISKKVGGFLGSTCAPIVKATGFCLSLIYNSVTDGWGAFSKEVAPEVENIKDKTYRKNISACLDAELQDISESEEETLKFQTYLGIIL